MTKFRKLLQKKPELVIGICFTRESPLFVRKDFNEWGKRKKFLSNLNVINEY